MKTVSRQMRDKAAQFLNNEARTLEKALHAYHFTGAPVTDVLSALATFQNSDGGFGHALEPDIRLDDSSVIGTTVAFQHFRELKIPADHPMLTAACRYLRDTYNPSSNNWPIIPSNVDDAPHAPWWVHNGELENSRSNPRAEIAGYLNEYPQHFPDEMRETVTRSVVDYLLAQPDSLEMHDLLCYIRLLETPALPINTKQTLLEKLQRVVSNVVERNPEAWRNYGLPPLAVIDSPDSPFAHLFTDIIQQNLDFIIEAQGDDGTWTPNWSWGDQWADAWESANRDWTGVITLDNLRKLRQFGRLSN